MKDKRSFKLILVMSLIVFLCCSGVIADRVDASDVTVSINPANYTVRHTNEIIQVEIQAANVNNLYGAEVHLSFDPECLEVVDTNGNLTTKANIGAAFATGNKFVAQNKVDNEQGKVDFTVTLLGKVIGKTGDTTVCTFNFKTKKALDSEIRLDEVILVQSDASVSQLSTVMPRIKNGQVTTETQTNHNPSGNNDSQTDKTSDKDSQQPVVEKQPPLSKPLHDIQGHWAEGDITRLVNNKIISGDPDGRFRPDDRVTRQEFAKMIVLAAGLQEELNPSLDLTDTNGIAGWAKGYVAAAVKAGIINGYADRSFKPQQNITRAEIAVMAVRALGLNVQAGNVSQFNDASGIPQWAQANVAAAAAKGIINGFPDGTFQAGGSATRAQAAKIISHILDN